MITKEDIHFPEEFPVKTMGEDPYATIVSVDNEKWGVKNLDVLIAIKKDVKEDGVGYDVLICIEGKDTEKLYSDRHEVLEKINKHVSSLFRRKAKEKDLFYRY